MGAERSARVSGRGDPGAWPTVPCSSWWGRGPHPRHRRARCGAPLGWSDAHGPEGAPVVTDRPYVRFSQHTLPNGLRVIVAPDRVAPVVAINLWYDVGSKHELPGKTGFAHLFEHFMFQGSRHVAKAEHLAHHPGRRRRLQRHHLLRPHQLLRDAALPPAGAGPLAGGGPDGHAARRPEPGEPGQPARRGQEREAPVATTTDPTARSTRSSWRPSSRHGHPYHHTPIGSMEDLDAASLEDVESFFRTWYVPNNAVLTIAGDVDEQPVLRDRGTLLRAHPGQPGPAGLALPRPGAGDRTAARSCPTRCRSSASTWATAVPPSARAPSTRSRWPPRSWPAAAAAGCHRRLVRDEQVAQDVALFTLPLVAGSSIVAGWVTAAPGVGRRHGGAASWMRSCSA